MKYEARITNLNHGTNFQSFLTFIGFGKSEKRAIESVRNDVLRSGHELYSGSISIYKKRFRRWEYCGTIKA
jgi:hypothetical protein